MISLSNEAKSKITLSNAEKGSNPTWAQTDPDTWEEHTDSTWETFKLVLDRATKSKISLSNEAK